MDEHQLQPGQSTGVILEIRPTDFVAGAETGIAYEARNPSGDWEPYKPTDEWQRYFLGTIFGYDTFSCVTFSALRIVQMQLQFMLEKNLIPAGHLEQMLALGWIDSEGHFNFNEHFTAVMSGTTVAGNTLQAVWDSIRNDGLLAQKDGPCVNDFTTREAWLDRSTITADQIAKAKKAKELLSVAYEWAIIDPDAGAWEQFRKHLKQAPLHVAGPVCLTWNRKDGLPVAYDGDTRLSHATSSIGISTDDIYKQLDHYSPFVKYLAKDYFLPYALKAIVTLKGAMPVQPATKPAPPTANLAYGAPDSAATRALQAVLQVLTHPTSGQPYLKPGVFGPFGPQTARALALFEQVNTIPDYPAGHHFGPRNRAAMSAELAARGLATN